MRSNQQYKQCFFQSPLCQSASRQPKISAKSTNFFRSLLKRFPERSTSKVALLHARLIPSIGRKQPNERSARDSCKGRGPSHGRRNHWLMQRCQVGMHCRVCFFAVQLLSSRRGWRKSRSNSSCERSVRISSLNVEISQDADSCCP